MTVLSGQNLPTTLSQADAASLPSEVESAVLLALAEVATKFTNERQLIPVLDQLLVSALAVVSADAGSIMLLSVDRDTLEVAAACGPRADLIRGTRHPADRSVAGWALRAGQTLLLHGSQLAAISDHPRDLASAVVVPLSVGGKLVGVLNASREPGDARMDAHAVRMLELLANEAAILIDSVQMQDEIQRKDVRLGELLEQLVADVNRKSVGRPLRDAVGRLTRREQDVVDLLVEGLTNREIAARLVVEPDTVKDHVQNIIKKFGAADRTHAAVIAVRLGLVV